MSNIRNAIANRMAVLTGGRMLAHSYLEPKTDVVRAAMAAIRAAGCAKAPPMSPKR
ncbi:hypothetical protein LP420_39730 [Massilia sp. B-10]|nr:hypothetical protein LP420_39730 [Massilia sp. B-10]